MQAVILAGGKGTRLSPLTLSLPKPLIPVAGKPLLWWTLQSLPAQITEVLIITNYLEIQIFDWIKQNPPPIPVSFFTQNPLDGTAGAIYQAHKNNRIKFPCLVVNGDDIYKQEDLASLINTSQEQACQSMLVFDTQGAIKSAIQVDDYNRITGFHDTAEFQPSLQCTGAYVLNHEFLKQAPVAVKTHAGPEFSLPHTLVALAQSNSPIQTTKAKNWLRVGTPAELETANRVMADK